jgi:hypothetical protein
VIAGVVLAVLVIVAYYSHRRGARWGWLLIAVSVLWFLVDKSVEGPTLVHLTHEHGLAAADLAGVAGVALGVHEVWRDKQVRR